MQFYVSSGIKSWGQAGVQLVVRISRSAWWFTGGRSGWKKKVKELMFFNGDVDDIPRFKLGVFFGLVLISPGVDFLTGLFSVFFSV